MKAPAPPASASPVASGRSVQLLPTASPVVAGLPPSRLPSHRTSSSSPASPTIAPGSGSGNFVTIDALCFVDRRTRAP